MEINKKISGFKEEISSVSGRIVSMVDERLTVTLGSLWPVSAGSNRDVVYGPLAERRFFMRLQNEEQAIDYKLRDISRYQVEIQKKFSVAFSCVVFVLIGAPIGVITRRGGIGTGLGISLIFFVVYYIFLIGGEELADRRFVSPAVAMWAANVIVGLVGLYLVSGVLFEWKLKRNPRMTTE
jgi:lipopolysaccharide export system permease protein